MTGIEHSDTGTEREDGRSDRRMDPETLAGSDGIEYAERTYAHPDEDHCEADADGRAVVGVTDGEGRLLQVVDRENERAMLPNDTVDPGEDWPEVARRAAADMLDVPVTVGDPVRVRRVTHTTEDDDEPHNESYHVLFAGSVADGASAPEPTAEDTPWEVGWFEGLPVDPPADRDSMDIIDDIRTFLE